MKILLPILSGLLLVAAGCRKTATAPAADSREWKYFVAHPDFIVELPANWKFVKVDDASVYTALFTNEHDSIEFNYSLKSGNFYGDSSNTVLTNDLIDDRNAVITRGKTAPYYKGLYIDSINGKGALKTALSMYQVSQPEINEEKALRIFRSIKFN